MRKLMSTAVLSFAALFIVSFFSCNSQVPKADLKTIVDSVSYAQGVLSAQQIEQVFMQLNLDESNKADFIKGFLEGFKIDPKDKKANAIAVGRFFGFQGSQLIPNFSAYLFGEDSTRTVSKENYLSGYLAAVMNDTTILINRDEAQMYSMMAMENIRSESNEKRFAGAIKENQEWLENNKSNEGVVVLPSGLQYKVIKEGSGAKPVASDKVKVNYRGTRINGEEFDSNTSVEFTVGGVISGWTEGLQLMSVGSKYMFYIPSDLAYKEQGMGEKIPPYSTLIFEVELLEIVK